jgi:hypothetical protein
VVEPHFLNRLSLYAASKVQARCIPVCGFFGLAAGCALRDDGLYTLPVMEMVNYDACGSVTGFILKSDCQDRSEYMYLWKVDALVADLKTGAVTQRDECLYMLLFMLIISFSTMMFACKDSPFNVYDLMDLILTPLLNVLGILYCYQVNSKGDNRDFILRVCCLGLPVVSRILVFTLPLQILVATVGFILSGSDITDDASIPTTLLEVAGSAVIMVLYYWYLASKIKAVASDM